MPRPRQSDSPLTQPLSGKRLRREIKAAGRLAVGPEKRIVKGERRTSKIQSRRINEWFPQYQEEIAKAAMRTTSAYSQADQRMANASATAADYAEQLRQNLAQEGMQDAQNRGVTYDPSGSQVGVEANLARINSSDTLRGVTASQGAAQTGMYADKSRIAERERIEQLLREQARRRSYTQDLKDLSKRQSDAMLQEKGRLRDSERDYYLGLLAARGDKKAQAFAEQNAKADRRFDRNQSAKDRKLTKSENAKDRNQSRWENKHGGSTSSGDGGKDKQRDATNVKSAVDALRFAYSKGKLSGHSKQEILANLRKETGFSNNELQAAWKRWSKNKTGNWAS